MSLISSSEDALYEEAQRLQKIALTLLEDDVEREAQVLFENLSRQLMYDVWKLVELRDWIDPGVVSQEMLHTALDTLITLVHAPGRNT